MCKLKIIKLKKLPLWRKLIFRMISYFPPLAPYRPLPMATGTGQI